MPPYQNPRSCIICGEPDLLNGNGSHKDYCKEHAKEVEYARKIKSNLIDAIRGQIASVTPECEPTSTQRAAICFSELSETTKLYVSYQVGKMVEAYEKKAIEYMRAHPKSVRKPQGIGALSAWELYYSLVEAGEL